MQGLSGHYDTIMVFIYEKHQKEKSISNKTEIQIDCDVTKVIQISVSIGCH